MNIEQKEGKSSGVIVTLKGKNREKKHHLNTLNSIVVKGN